MAYQGIQRGVLPSFDKNKALVIKSDCYEMYNEITILSCDLNQIDKLKTELDESTLEDFVFSDIKDAIKEDWCLLKKAQQEIWDYENEDIIARADFDILETEKTSDFLDECDLHDEGDYRDFN